MPREIMPMGLMIGKDYLVCFLQPVLKCNKNNFGRKKMQSISGSEKTNERDYFYAEAA